MSVSFKLIERVGISTVSISGAIKNALLELNKEEKVSWFEVIEQRGRLTSNGEVEFQVTIKVGVKI